MFPKYIIFMCIYMFVQILMMRAYFWLCTCIVSYSSNHNNGKQQNFNYNTISTHKMTVLEQVGVCWGEHSIGVKWRSAYTTCTLSSYIRRTSLALHISVLLCVPITVTLSKSAYSSSDTCTHFNGNMYAYNVQVRYICL